MAVAVAVIAYKGTCPHIPHDTQHVNRTNIRANRRSIEHVYQCCAYNKPPGRGVSPRSKSRGAGSLVLTLNARWNIFGLPVTHEVFTYLVVATVVAPYILCIIFLGLMLMAVKLA